MSALLLTTALAAPALAESPAAEDQPSPVATETSAEPTRTVVRVVTIEDEAPVAAPQGLVAVRDAETGELRAPTAAEMSQLSATLDPLSRSADGLQEIHYSDGSVGVRLQGRFMSLSTVEHRADGSVDSTCTHNAAHAAEILSADDASEEASDVR